MVKFLKSDVSGSQDLSADALSVTTTFTKPFKLEQITIHASVAITEDITITLDSAKGANYDVVLRARSLSSEQDFVYKPEGETNYQAGDNIKLQCTDANATGVVYYLIKCSEL